MPSTRSSLLNALVTDQRSEVLDSGMRGSQAEAQWSKSTALKTEQRATTQVEQCVCALLVVSNDNNDAHTCSVLDQTQSINHSSNPASRHCRDCPTYPPFRSEFTFLRYCFFIPFTSAKAELLSCGCCRLRMLQQDVHGAIKSDSPLPAALTKANLPQPPDHQLNFPLRHFDCVVMTMLRTGAPFEL